MNQGRDPTVMLTFTPMCSLSFYHFCWASPQITEHVWLHYIFTRLQKQGNYRMQKSSKASRKGRNMYVCVYIYMYTQYVYIHIYMYIYVYTSVYIYIYMWSYVITGSLTLPINALSVGKHLFELSYFASHPHWLWGEEPLTLGNVTIHKLPSSDTLFFMNNICGHTALYPPHPSLIKGEDPHHLFFSCLGVSLLPQPAPLNSSGLEYSSPDT